MWWRSLSRASSSPISEQQLAGSSACSGSWLGTPAGRAASCLCRTRRGTHDSASSEGSLSSSFTVPCHTALQSRWMHHCCCKGVRKPGCCAYVQGLTAGRLTWCIQCRYDAIRTGEPAEVLVLSKNRSFESFKVYHLTPEKALASSHMHGPVSVQYADQMVAATNGAYPPLTWKPNSDCFSGPLKPPW